MSFLFEEMDENIHPSIYEEDPVESRLVTLRSQKPYTSDFQTLVLNYFRVRYPIEGIWHKDTGFCLKTSSEKNILEVNFTTLSNVLRIKEIKRDIIESLNVDFEGGEITLENDSDIEQDLSTKLGTSKSFTITNEIKFSKGFTTEVKVSPKLFGFGAEFTGQINLGTERNKQWTKEETFSISPTNIKVPAKSKVTINYSVKRTKVKVQGVAKVKLDPNQTVYVHCYPYLKFSEGFDISAMERIMNPRLHEFLEYASKYVALDELTSYFTIENGEIFANVPYESICENYGQMSIKVGEIIYSRPPLERWIREQLWKLNIFSS